MNCFTVLDHENKNTSNQWCKPFEGWIWPTLGSIPSEGFLCIWTHRPSLEMNRTWTLCPAEARVTEESFHGYGFFPQLELPGPNGGHPHSSPNPTSVNNITICWGPTSRMFLLSISFPTSDRSPNPGKFVFNITKTFHFLPSPQHLPGPNYCHLLLKWLWQLHSGLSDSNLPSWLCFILQPGYFYDMNLLLSLLVDILEWPPIT